MDYPCSTLLPGAVCTSHPIFKRGLKVERYKLHYRSVFFTVLLILTVCLNAAAIEMPLPQDNPDWQKFEKLWQDRHSGKHCDEMSGLLEAMQRQSPDKAAIYLWQANVKTFQARENKNDPDLLKQAEKLICRAREIDPDNPYAFRLLLNVLPGCADRAYLMQNYGDWVNQASPQKAVRQLPLIDDPAWRKALSDWDRRKDIEKAAAAVAVFEAYAQAHPQNGLAQLWVSRGNYYLGEYYLSMDRYEDSARQYYLKGVRFGEDALRLLPDDVRSHYWLMVNEARSIQFDSLLSKAKSATSIRTHLMFCLRDDGLYYFGGPSMLEAIGLRAGGKVGSKVMEFIGINSATVIRELDMAAILYPEIFYLPYCKALLLVHTGQKDAAVKVLDELIERNPDQSELYTAENHCILRLSRLLRESV